MKKEGTVWKKAVAGVGVLFLTISTFGNADVSLAAEPEGEKAYPQVAVDEVVWNGGDIEIPLDLAGLKASDLSIDIDSSDGSQYLGGRYEYDDKKMVIHILDNFSSCDKGLPLSEAGNYPVTIRFEYKNSGEFICDDTFTLVNPVTSKLWDVSYEYVDFDGTQDVVFHFENGTNYYKLLDIPYMHIYTPMESISLNKGTDYTVNMTEGTVTIDKDALSNALNKYFADGYVFFEDTTGVNANGLFSGNKVIGNINRLDYVGPDQFFDTDCAWKIDISKFTPGEPEDTEDISGEFTGSDNTSVTVSEKDAAAINADVLNYVDRTYKEAIEDLGECSVTSTLKVDEQATEEIDQSVREAFADVAEDAVVGKYYDIKLMANVLKDGKNVEGLTDINIPELSQSINISLKIPSEILKEGRTFKMLHYHNGKAEILNSTVTGDTISFETDAFSPFALVYADKEGDSMKPGNGNTLPGDKQQTTQTSVQKEQKMTAPKTGDTNSIALPIMAGGLAVIVIVSIVVKKKMAA